MRPSHTLSPKRHIRTHTRAESAVCARKWPCAAADWSGTSMPAGAPAIVWRLYVCRITCRLLCCAPPPPLPRVLPIPIAILPPCVYLCVVLTLRSLEAKPSVPAGFSHLLAPSSFSALLLHAFLVISAAIGCWPPTFWWLSPSIVLLPLTACLPPCRPAFDLSPTRESPLAKPSRRPTKDFYDFLDACHSSSVAEGAVACLADMCASTTSVFFFCVCATLCA